MIKAYIDAATKGNPGPSGGGLMLTGDHLYIQESFALPELSNHQAEFASFCAVLDYLLANDYQNQTIMVYTDSKILAQTVDKNYTNNPDFQDYLENIQEKLTSFPLLILQWIPESKNKGADNLARQGLQKALNLQNRRK